MGFIVCKTISGIQVSPSLVESLSHTLQISKLFDGNSPLSKIL